MDQWIRVFEDQNQIRAEIVKGVLEEKGIPAIVMNKKETVYKLYGTYEVLVPNEKALEAMQLIQNEISF
jgi:predicted glycosyltransferase